VKYYLNTVNIILNKDHYKQALKFIKNSKTKNEEYYLLNMKIENGLGKYDEG
jgi:hypothetical protein